MGFCLNGNDINDQTSPIEAGLSWITKFTDHKDFIEKDLLLKQKKSGVNKKLRGFVMIDRGIPRQHYEVVDRNGNKIGEVTSGTMSPMMKQGIGMAYLPKEYWKPGSEIFIRIRNRDLRASVVNFPITINNEGLMRILKTCFSPTLYEPDGHQGFVVVVIDVLRATSAICTAFAHGAAEIIPVATVEEL